jgi:hypothetical protein
MFKSVAPLPCVIPDRDCSKCAEHRWLNAFMASQRSILALERKPRAVVLKPSMKQGLGNRLHGISFALVLATLTERLLILDYPGNVPSELDYLAPSRVLWNASEYPERVQDWLRTARRSKNNNRVRPSLPSSWLRQLQLQDSDVTVAPLLLINSLFYNPTDVLLNDTLLRPLLLSRGLNQQSVRSSVKACATHAIFSPRPALAAAFHQSRAQMGSRKIFDIAIHVRLEENHTSQRVPLMLSKKVASNFVTCAGGHAASLARAGQTADIAHNTSWFVASTRQMALSVRSEIELLNHGRGRFEPARILSLEPSDPKAFHSGLGRNSFKTAAAALLSALLDLLNLASARILIGSKGSTFSEHAALISAGAGILQSAILVPITGYNNNVNHAPGDHVRVAKSTMARCRYVESG